jgi:hypothetical protein
LPQEDRQHNHRDERKKSIQGVAGLSGFDVQAGGFDSLQSCRPFSSPCSARSSSWSAHAPRCTWRSSRSEHQVSVVHRSRRPRLGLTSADRVLCAWLSQAWSGWRSAVHIVKTETVSMAPARLSPVLEVEEAATGSATAAGTAAGRAAKGVAAVGVSTGSRRARSGVVSCHLSLRGKPVGEKGARDHGRMHLGVQALRSRSRAERRVPWAPALLLCDQHTWTKPREP